MVLDSLQQVLELSHSATAGIPQNILAELVEEDEYPAESFFSITEFANSPANRLTEADVPIVTWNYPGVEMRKKIDILTVTFIAILFDFVNERLNISVILLEECVCST